MPVPSKNEVVQEPESLLQPQGSTIPSLRHQRRDGKDAVEREKKGGIRQEEVGGASAVPQTVLVSPYPKLSHLRAFPAASCLGTLPSHSAETPWRPELCFHCQ